MAHCKNELPFPNDQLERLILDYQGDQNAGANPLSEKLEGIARLTYQHYRQELEGDPDFLQYEAYIHGLLKAAVWRKDDGQAFAFIQCCMKNRMRDVSRRNRRQNKRDARIVADVTEPASCDPPCLDEGALDDVCAISSLHAAAAYALVNEVPAKFREPVKRLEMALSLSEVEAVAIIADVASAVSS